MDLESISAVYNNLQKPGGLGCVKQLKQACGISEKRAKEFLQKEESYTRHKQVRKTFRRRKVTSPSPNYLWQADLVFMQKYSRQNRGYKYILTVIDVFSKKAFAVPLKKKTACEVVRGFNDIFSVHKRKPSWIQCDEITEFLSEYLRNT